MRIAPKKKTTIKKTTGITSSTSTSSTSSSNNTSTTSTTKLLLATCIGFSLGLIVMFTIMFQKHFVFEYYLSSSSSSNNYSIDQPTYQQQKQQQRNNVNNNHNNNNVDDDDDVDILSYLTDGERIFFNTANSLKPTTDKVTSHSYQHMYGQFLLPYYYKNPTMKMLEIGLGCNMNYGPGASVELYKRLFPKAELWEAEYDENCINKHLNNNNNNNNNSSSKSLLEGINILVGDQGDVNTLSKWIETTDGGNFDVIIDDGGHENCQIWTSFTLLWPTIKPGGLYFIEDLQVAKLPLWNKYSNPPTCTKGFNMPNKIKQYIDNLIYSHDNTLIQQEEVKPLNLIDDNKEFEVIQQHPSDGIKFIYCQRQACVIGKQD